LSKDAMLVTGKHLANVGFSIRSVLFGCFQCNIAHALEKTKYPDSDIYWEKFEEKYHFSCQFTADLIAMNHADFIITSTYQEIAGRLVLCQILISLGSNMQKGTQ